MENIIKLSWYDYYVLNQYTEISDLKKEAGVKETSLALISALIMMFSGEYSAEAASAKTNIPIHKLEKAKQNPYLANIAKKELAKRTNNTPKVSPTLNTKQSISTEEQIARTLFAEAAGESIEGKKAVASVIWNRAKQDKNNVLSVIKKRKQFSCWNSGMPKAGRGQAWEDCLNIAKEITNGTFVSTVSYNSYYAPSKANPKWAYTKDKKTLRPHEDIGNHRFLNT